LKNILQNKNSVLSFGAISRYVQFGGERVKGFKRRLYELILKPSFELLPKKLFITLFSGYN